MNAYFCSFFLQKITLAAYFRGILALAFFFSLIIFFSPFSRPVLNVEVVSSVSGVSQVFFYDGASYSEKKSLQLAVKKGDNRLAYPLSILASPIRWDPFNSPGTVEVSAASFTLFGVELLSGGISFRPLNQIESIGSVSGNVVVHMQADAFDPELELIFDAGQLNKARALLSVVAGVAVALFVFLLMSFAKYFNSLCRALPSWLFVIALLAFLNLYVFYDHVFGHNVFPWDFSITYHAVPNYWLTSLHLGQFPFWVPFQGIGYPLLMNMQSGLFYLPNYLFYVFNVPYTLHAAVVFQVIHVFFSGVGAYVLLRKSGHDVLTSTIGGVAYNLFGGFFCNSEHVDIVRSFVFLPWIFAGLADLMKNGVKPFPVIMLPMMLLFQWTGGYPGASISILFISFVFIFVSAVARECSWKHFLMGGGLMMSGVIMASPAFLPVLMMKGEIARSAEAGSLVKTYVSPVNLTSLIQRIDYEGLPNDISMRSLHILIIPFVFIFFVSMGILKRNLGMAAVACCALLMAMGGWFFDIVVEFFPPLGYSRFPSADYRGLIALALIYFAMLGYQEYKIISFGGMKDRLMRFALFGVLTYFVVDPLLANQDAFVFTLVMILLVILALCIHRLKLSPLTIFVLFFSIQVADFIRIEADQVYWNNLSSSEAHSQKFGSLKTPAKLLTQRIEGLDTRAERSDEFRGYVFGFQGYLTGIYMVGDYSGPMQFIRQRYIMGNPELLNYAKKAWTPVLFDSQPGADEAISGMKSGSDDARGRVKLTLYKPNHIEYVFKSEYGFGFIENETYFPGWTMTLDDGVKIEAKDVHGFRYWEIPAGKYKAVAKFNMPYFRISFLLAICGVIGYLLGVAYLLKLHKNQSRLLAV